MKNITDLIQTIQESRLTIITAYSFNHYTFGELKLVSSMVIKSKLSIAMLSLLDRKASTIKSLISAYADLEIGKLEEGVVNDKDFKKIVDIAEALYNTSLFFDEINKKSTDVCIKKIHRLKEDTDISILFLDYFEELSVKRLKELSIELNISVVLFIHRDVDEYRKKPNMSNLLPAKSIEPFADCILFAKERSTEEAYSLFYTMKNRNGPLDTYQISN